MYRDKTVPIKVQSKPMKLSQIGDAALNRCVGFSNFESESLGKIDDKTYSKRRRGN
jgi:hypothetical protein